MYRNIMIVDNGRGAEKSAPGIILLSDDYTS